MASSRFKTEAQLTAHRVREQRRRERLRSGGLKQVSVWVPEEDAERFQNWARILRETSGHKTEPAQ